VKPTLMAVKRFGLADLEIGHSFIDYIWFANVGLIWYFKSLRYFDISNV